MAKYLDKVTHIVIFKQAICVVLCHKMHTMINKILILNKLKDYYNFTTHRDFADFLGIAPTTVSSWYSRNTWDFDVLYTKCVGVSWDAILSNSDEHTVLSNANSQQSRNTEPEIPHVTNELIALLKEKDDKITAMAEEIGALKYKITQLDNTET